MNATSFEKGLLVYFRVLMGWTFLYASSHQLFDPNFSASGFLEHTKTFHSFFVLFAAPAIRPVTDFLVEWGHLLIGLSLLSGLLVRVSGVFGILLLVTYYFAHMDFPYIESKLNFIVDYHLVYAGVIAYLMAKQAGHVLGLDGVVARTAFVKTHPGMAALV
ncbi:MAG TPA: DoxX family protein [Burkholderiales bacterium]|nr:DoxX family protein [Burkholderiales bacterium]